MNIQKTAPEDLSPQDARSELSRLAKLILKHDRAYHLDDSPKVSDAAYDELRARNTRIEELHPQLTRNDSPSQRVGFPLEWADGLKKAVHRVPMLSLDNLMLDADGSIEGFVERMRKHAQDISFVVQPKLDGLSLSVLYEDGRLSRALTRGDGVQGEDVTLNVQGGRIQGIPERLAKPCPSLLEVRGEAILPFEAFERTSTAREAKGKPPLANPRNAAAGLMRQMDPAATAEAGLEFLVHGFSRSERNPGATWTRALENIRSWGLLPVEQSAPLSDPDAIRTACEAWRTRKPTLPHDIDGVVLKVDDRALAQSIGSTGHAPRHDVAVKFPPDQAEAVLKGISIQVGRLGALTPVAELSPTTVGGVVVRRATLHNQDMVEKLDVRIGDVVSIRRAGEVIPQVVQVQKDRRPKDAKPYAFPKACPSCGGQVSREAGEAALRCTAGRSCDEQAFQHLARFVERRHFEISGLGETQLRALWANHAVQEPADLFALADDPARLEALEEAPGWGRSSVRRLRDAVHARREMPAGRVLHSLGIPFVGRSTAPALAEAWKGDLHALLADAALAKEDSSQREKLLAVPDIGPKIVDSLREFASEPSTRDMAERLLRKIEITKEPLKQAPSGDSTLAGKTLVFTGRIEGMTRSEAGARAEALGAKASSALSRRTDYLVAGEGGGAKRSKAEGLGVEIMPAEKFLEILTQAEGESP